MGPAGRWGPVGRCTTAAPELREQGRGLVVGPECQACVAVAAHADGLDGALRAADDSDDGLQQVGEAEAALAALAVEVVRRVAVGHPAVTCDVVLGGGGFEDEVGFDIAKL